MHLVLHNSLVQRSSTTRCAAGTVEAQLAHLHLFQPQLSTDKNRWSPDCCTASGGYQKRKETSGGLADAGRGGIQGMKTVRPALKEEGTLNCLVMPRTRPAPPAHCIVDASRRFISAEKVNGRCDGQQQTRPPLHSNHTSPYFRSQQINKYHLRLGPIATHSRTRFPSHRFNHTVQHRLHLSSPSGCRAKSLFVQRDSSGIHRPISLVHAHPRAQSFNPYRDPPAQFHTTLRLGCEALTLSNMDSDVESVISSFQDESDDFTPEVSPSPCA